MILDIYENCNDDKGCIDRWERWKDHRQIINDILYYKIFCNDKIKEAVILGAGRCEDLDLKFLLKNVESLTLVDYDYNSMKQSLNRQKLTIEERQKVILKGHVEFTGFYEEEFINEVTNRIKEKQEVEDIINFVIEKLHSANSNIIELLGNKEYSLVISGAVHSQLIVPLMEIILVDTVYANAFMPKIGYIANTLGEKYNKSLLSLMKYNGWMFSFYDVMELSERNNTLQYEEIINNLISKNEYKEIDAIINKKGGVAGARHSYYHLENLVMPYKPYKQSWIWQFRENKKYYVRSLCLKNI